MTAFATADDLALRLKRDFTSDETAWVTALLDDAAGFLRGVIGARVYPSATTTITMWPSDGWVDLPQPFRSITSVTDTDGNDVKYRQHQASLRVRCNDAIKVTGEYGYDNAPDDLVSFNCALVGQQILTVEAQVGLTAGGLSSVALDDFKVAFADAGGMTGLALPEHTITYLRDAYGCSGYTTEANR